VLLLLAAAGCGERPEAAMQRRVARGEALLAAGKASEAIIELRNALAVDKDHVPALLALGRAYAAKAWFYDATRELGRAQGLAPDSLPIAAAYGRALAELGDWPEAEAQAARILAPEPASPDGLYIRSVALIGRARPAEALAVVEGAQEVTSRSVELRAVRAEALLALGRVDEAEEAFKAVLAEAPADARSLSGLGAVIMSRRRYEEAARLYLKAKELHPDAPRIRLALASALARLRRLPEAIKELEEVELRARSPDITTALGIFYLQDGQINEAVTTLGALVRRRPRLAQARLLFATALMASGDAEGAIRELSALQQQVPDDPAVTFRLALAEAQVGLAREALARLDGLARSFAGQADFHLERARVLLLLGKTGEALAAAGRARTLAPRAPQPLLLLGEIRAQQGDLRGAREAFEAAAALDAHYAPARLGLGRVAAAEGQPDAALREFEAAVQADPRSLPAARARAAALVQRKRLGEAVASVQGAIEANPRAAGFHVLLGSLQLEAGQLDAAAAAYRRAVELERRNVEARLGLARIALARGNEHEAAGQLHDAVRVRPDQPTAVLLLTSLHAKAGRADLSLPVLEAAVKASPRQPTFAFLLGDVYVRTGRTQEAIDLATRLLAERPDLVRARLIRGQALLAKGDGQGALREVTEAVRRHPDSAEAQYLLAHVQAGLGRPEQAAAAYRQALRLQPGFEAARVELAILAGGRAGADSPEARAQLERLRAAVDRDPRNVLLREALARALFLRGRTADAHEELRRILEIAPLHLGGNYLTAQVLLAQGKRDEAARHLETVLRGNPAHLESQLLLARYLHDKGRLPEAMAHLEAVVKAQPELPEARLQLGLLYAQAGRLDEALSLAQELERGNVPGGAVPLLKGLVLLARREARAALEPLGEAARREPRRVEPHRALGVAYQTLGQADRATESYRRALTLRPDDVVSLNNLALVLAELRGQPDQALPLAQRALELAPERAAVLDTLGWVQYRRKAYPEAERLLAQAAERAPGDARVQYHLGMTYYRQGKRREALFALRRASQLDPALAERESLAPLLAELDR
jgi:tetratricopeptide (TPR) repeat protein